MHECIPTRQRGVIDFSLSCDEVMSNTTAGASACSCILCTEMMNVNEACSSRYHARLVDTHKSSQGQIPALTYCVSSCCQLTWGRLRSNSVSKYYICSIFILLRIQDGRVALCLSDLCYLSGQPGSNDYFLMHVSSWLLHIYSLRVYFYSCKVKMIFFLKMIFQTFSALSHAGFKIDLISWVSHAQPQVLFIFSPSQREKSGDVVGGSSGAGGSIVATSSSGVGVVTSVGGGSASSSTMASSLTSLTSGGHGGHLGEEPSDLEELEQFARTFKQRRIKLGFTQVKEREWRGSLTGVRVCVCLSLISDTVYLSLSGRRRCGYGQTIRQRLQPDHHLPIWSTQPEF